MDRYAGPSAPHPPIAIAVAAATVAVHTRARAARERVLPMVKVFTAPPRQWSEHVPAERST